jgi:hypothetical protein
MRFTIMGSLLLLLLAACTIREDTFSSRDRVEIGGFAINSPDLNASIAGGDERACQGGFARGSRIDEYRDGSVSLFCN